MKPTPDLAQRLSETCMKIMLAALVLSALAFGLAEKFHDATSFEAFAKYEIARETLDAQVTDLQNDLCWQRYARAQPSGADATHITLFDLKTIQCSDQAIDKVQVGATKLDVPADSSGDPTFAVHSTPSAVQPLNPQTPTRDAEQRNGPRVPAAPGSVQIWVPLDVDESIEQTLQTLWDERLLAAAKKYSAVGAEEIYRWELFRAHLDARLALLDPGMPSRGRLSKLRVSDLQQINHLAHGELGDIDRVVRDSFRAALPETSLGVRIGTAAQVVCGALTLVMVIFAAYMRAAINADAVSARGTVFSVLIGSRTFEIAGLVLICIPAASLARAVDWRGEDSFVAGACAVLVLCVTISIAWRIVPLTGLNVPIERRG